MTQTAQPNGRLPARQTDWPSVSIAICTRNRHESLRRAVAAVVAADPAVEELLIVDQSDEFIPLERPWARGFRHVRSDSRGLSRARNEALRLATTDIVFFTDDDCLVQPGAVEAAVTMFVEHPEVGLVFGAVRAEPSVTAEGLISVYEPRRQQICRNRVAAAMVGGMGACMAVRRQTALAIGGFDVRLGVGGPIPGGEDCEFAHRIQKMGYSVGTEPCSVVIHEGIKPWCTLSRHFYEAFYSIGAAYGFHLKIGDLYSVLPVMKHTIILAFAIMRNIIIGRRRGLGVKRLVALWHGFISALRRPAGAVNRC